MWQKCLNSYITPIQNNHNMPLSMDNNLLQKKIQMAQYPDKSDMTDKKSTKQIQYIFGTSLYNAR